MSIKPILIALWVLLMVPAQLNAQTGIKADSDRQSYGLKGNVATLAEGWCTISKKPDAVIDCQGKQHIPLRTITFTMAGRKILEVPPPYICGFAWRERGQRTIREYRDNGSLLEETTYNHDGSLDSKSIKRYDSAGRESEAEYYNKNGLLWLKWTHKYDEKGKEIEAIRYKGDGSLDVKQVYNRDKLGRVAEFIEYRADGSIGTRDAYTYEYDSEGNWIKIVTSEWVTKRKKSYYRPYRVDYRIITVNHRR